jgi:hypothetical protein
MLRPLLALPLAFLVCAISVVLIAAVEVLEAVEPGSEA